MTKKTQKALNRIATKHTIKENVAAFRVYETYKKAVEIIDRTERASGKWSSFRSDVGSTLNFEVNRHGAYSTITQSI